MTIEARTGMLGVARLIARPSDSVAGARFGAWADGSERIAAGTAWLATIAALALWAGSSSEFSGFRTNFPRSAVANGSLRAASARGASGSATYDRSRPMQFTIHAAAASAATLLAICADAADIRVPQDFPTIQAAVDAANPGDRVLVAPGTYAPFTFHAKHVTVESTGGETVTTIDATGMSASAVSFEAGTGFDTVLRGFRVLTGFGTPVPGGAVVGGGCSLLGDFDTGVPACGTIEDCAFIGATGGCWSGGGIYASPGNIAVRRCSFDGISTIHFGGAITLFVISGVAVPDSGGCESVIEDCRIANTSSYNDGGIWVATSDRVQAPAKVRIARTEFLSNQAGYAAGAILLWSPYAGASQLDADIDSCRFAGNGAPGANSIGCGLPGQGGGSFIRNLSVQKSLFEDGGISINGGDAQRVAISNSAFCSGSSAIASPYVDAGGNSFTCDLSTDCDRDGVADLISTTLGQVADANHDHVPDACQCTGDINRDGVVNGSDLGGLLAFWGPNPAFPRADINADGRVDGADLGVLLSNWGPCPQ